MISKKSLLRNISFVSLFFLISGCVHTNCPLPAGLNYSVKTIHLNSHKESADLKRNARSMGSLCANRIAFHEGGQQWNFLLVWNPSAPKGPFWYLPHDNEESAFSAAVYAAKRYGGGFLAVEANGQRYASGKDPNRNFKKGSSYSKNIFKIIDTYKSSGMPYLALHSNEEGHLSSGGSGTVSIRNSSKNAQAFPAGTIETGHQKGLQDEDSLIYLAGKTIDKKRIKQFNAAGLHVKYETVTASSNDNSMSNYIVLQKNGADYINIEVEHGDTKTQKKMIDRIMKVLK